MRVEEFLDRSAARSPDKTAIVCGGDRWSYRLVREQSRGIAHALLDHGLRRGDRVAICLENGIEAVVSLFGVLAAGGAFVIVNPRVRREQLSSVLADSGASMLISGAAHLATLRDGGPALTTHLRTVILVGAAHNVIVPPNVAFLRFGHAVTASCAGCDLDGPRSDADVAALVYTSGSTGRPKGVMLTHRNFAAAAQAICAYLDNTSNDVILNALPLAFTYGLGQITTAFSCGATVVLERSFVFPQAVIRTMMRENVTGFPLVPTMATLLLQQDLNGYRLPYLRYITNAAAALSSEKMRRLRAAFPAARLYSMYGLTECQRASYLPPDRLDAHPTSVGIAIPGTKLYIVDEDGRLVPDGTTGELVVHGPTVMAGYWNDAGATTRVLRAGPVGGETMLYTGDLFRRDRDGFLYFVERKDDVIKTRGEKVAPRQVEETIARLPDVAEVAVFGVPDDLLDEAIAAVIVPRTGSMLTPERVRRHCALHLEPFMVPTIIDIRDEVPTTLTGKVSRRQLRAMVLDAHAPSV